MSSVNWIDFLPGVIDLVSYEYILASLNLLNDLAESYIELILDQDPKSKQNFFLSELLELEVCFDVV